jgi:putative hydrolase of the HAD superfamily
MDRSSPAAIDWQPVRLVGFDVDGTLYRQRPLRLRMALELARHALARRDLTTPRVLSRYRIVRERLAEQEVRGFAARLLAETAVASSLPQDRVCRMVDEWIRRRPLKYIAALRYEGIAALFDGLRRQGKIIGIVSDYAADEKLEALRLEADIVVAAEDTDVGVLKPHPLALMTLLARAGVSPEQAVFIGDRVERDGVAARRAGVRALIRSSRPIPGWPTFPAYTASMFHPLLEA